MYTSSLAKTASALLSSGIIPQSAPVPPTSAQRCGHCPAAVSPFAVPELVEAKERMIAHTAEVAVMRRSLLLPIERALGTVHVQDDSLVPGSHHSLVYLSGIQMPQPTQILLADKDLGLKLAHRVGAGCLLLQCPAVRPRLA